MTDLADWIPPPLPSRTPIRGRYVTLEPLGRAHAADLFEAFAEDGGAMWDYLPTGPHKDLASYIAWLDAARLGALNLRARRARSPNGSTRATGAFWLRRKHRWRCPPSPRMAARRGRVTFMAMGSEDEAGPATDRGVREFPVFPTSWQGE